MEHSVLNAPADGFMELYEAPLTQTAPVETNWYRAYKTLFIILNAMSLVGAFIGLLFSSAILFLPAVIANLLTCIQGIVTTVALIHKSNPQESANVCLAYIISSLLLSIANWFAYAITIPLMRIMQLQLLVPAALGLF